MDAETALDELLDNTRRLFELLVSASDPSLGHAGGITEESPRQGIFEAISETKALVDASHKALDLAIARRTPGGSHATPEESKKLIEIDEHIIQADVTLNKYLKSIVELQNQLTLMKT